LPADAPEVDAGVSRTTLGDSRKESSQRSGAAT
jgi:hypothetical protein